MMFINLTPCIADILKPFTLHNFSKQGLMSFEFFEPGIYYFSDHNFNEAAEYIGTIIVKPKQIEHYVEITPEGFSPGKSQNILFLTSKLVVLHQ